MTFLLGGFVQSLARSLRRHIRPFFFSDPRTPNPSLWTLSSYTPSQLFYSIISIASVQLVINYAAIPFILLDLSTSLEGWKVMLFYGHALTGAGLLLFMAGAGTVLDRLNGNAAAKARARKEAKERMEREKVNGDGGGKKGELQVPDVDHAVDAAKKKMDEVKKDL